MLKKILSLFLLLTVALTIHATDYKESFTGLTSQQVTDGVHDLSLGAWTFSGMSLSSSQLKFNSGAAQIVSPRFSKISKLGFSYRSGGSNKVMTISYSTDGANWTELKQFTIPSSSSSYSTFSMETGLGAVEEVQFRIAATSNSYIKDFVVSDDEVDGGDAGNVDYTDDPDYKTEGVWQPVKELPQGQHIYYVSTAGNDQTGDGSLDNPWYNLAVAYAAAQPGDEIVLRGGRYHICKYGTDGKLTIRMNKKGTAEAPIVIRCYEGERPVLDFEQQLLDCNRSRSKVGDRGILLTGDYHILYGIGVMHAADNGIKLEGSHNRIERCEFSYCLDTGLQLGFGHNFSDTGFGSKNDGSHCAYNDIIDCDSHHNCDYDTNYGSDADGFACKMHNGKGNRFIRCRAWRNGDDAWDLYETDFSVVIAECWAWESAKPEDHLWVKEYLDGSLSFSGNGNGIKLGGNGSGGSSMGVHYVYDCIAFGCNRTNSVKGFDCNHHKDGHVVIGCLGFDNGYDYMFESGGSASATVFYNNVCLGRQEICVGTDDYNAINTPPTKNAWSHHLLTGVTKADYLSLDEEEALKPRSLDGSFPRTFGRLKSNSPMVDCGSSDYDVPNGTLFDPLREVIADYPFLQHVAQGTSRDLGPYEVPSASGEEESIDTVRDEETTIARYTLFGQRTTQGGLVLDAGKRRVIFIR